MRFYETLHKEYDRKIMMVNINFELILIIIQSLHFIYIHTAFKIKTDLFFLTTFQDIRLKSLIFNNQCNDSEGTTEGGK